MYLCNGELANGDEFTTIEFDESIGLNSMLDIVVKGNLKVLEIEELGASMWTMSAVQCTCKGECGQGIHHLDIFQQYHY